MAEEIQKTKIPCIKTFLLIFENFSTRKRYIHTLELWSLNLFYFIFNEYKNICHKYFKKEKKVTKITRAYAVLNYRILK